MPYYYFYFCLPAIFNSIPKMRVNWFKEYGRLKVFLAARIVSIKNFLETKETTSRRTARIPSSIITSLDAKRISYRDQRNNTEIQCQQPMNWLCTARCYLSALSSLTEMVGFQFFYGSVCISRYKISVWGY